MSRQAHMGTGGQKRRRADLGSTLPRIAPLLLTSRQLVGVVRGVLAEPSRIFSICLRASLRLLRVVCSSVCVSVSACDRCSLIACSLLSLSSAGASVALQPPLPSTGARRFDSASALAPIAFAFDCSPLSWLVRGALDLLSRVRGGWARVRAAELALAKASRSRRWHASDLAPLRSPCT